MREEVSTRPLGRVGPCARATTRPEPTLAGEDQSVSMRCWPASSQVAGIAAGDWLIDTRNVNCPRDSAALRQIVRKGTTIDVCIRCDGKWLDQGELEELISGSARSVASPGAVEKALAATERTSFFHASDRDPEIACPRCGIVMPKVWFESGNAEVTADRCENCHGLWLDSGETGALFAFLEERLPIRRNVWVLVATSLGLGLFTAFWLAGNQ